MKPNTQVVQAMCLKKLKESQLERINEKLLVRIMKRALSRYVSIEALVEAVCEEYLKKIGFTGKVEKPEKEEKKSPWELEGELGGKRKHLLDFSRRW